ncbi:MAG: replicative DNA helicase [bacterium]|nr:replicative DNA helicase [bacterium]
MDHRTPPHSEEAERSVLGGTLRVSDAYKKAQAIVGPTDFYHERHRLVFVVMGELNEGGTPIDLITVQEALGRKGQLEEIGGTVYLSQLLGSTPTAGHIRHHAKIVKEKATQRKLLEATHRMQDEIYEGGKSADEVGHRSIATISQIVQGSNSTKAPDMAETMVSTINILEEHAGTDRTTLGVPTGFTEYDQMIGGFCPTDLIVIASRPAVGKTSLLCSMVDHQARVLGRGVAIFSLEQPKEELGRKFIALLKRTIDMKQFRTGPISDSFWETVTGAAKSLSGLPIYIEDHTRQTVYQIADRARVLAADKSIEVVYIDYLQLIHSHRSKDPPNIIIGEQTKELKALARELRVPVVLMAQVSRDAERRADKRPQLSELRWSGDIEQDADLVTFIHREDLYSDGGAGEPVVDVELIVRKNRHGPTGTAFVKFVKRTTHFVQNYCYGDYESEQ